MSDQNFTNSRPPSYGSIGTKGRIPRERNGQQELSTISQDLLFEEQARHEGYISLPGFSDEEEDEEERDYDTLLNEYLITTPFIILAIVSFIILLFFWPEGTAEQYYKWDIFLFGGTGWCSVFFIKKPIHFVFSKLISIKVSLSSVLTLFFIGFIEEIIRSGWLYYFVDDDKFLIAYWLGLGWATAEAIYFIIQNFMELRWYKDDLELGGSKYHDEREELEEILGRPLTKVSAWWGVMWRFSWIMIHIGFSCWIAFSSILVYPAAFIHGLLIVVWGYCLPTFGIPATSYGTLLISISTFLIGLALFGKIV